MKNIKHILGAMAFALAMNTSANANLINFDDQTVSGIQPASGSLYSAQGITFSSGDVPSSFNSSISVGDVFTLTGILDQFVLINNSNSVSSPNFAGARNLGLQDTLMEFSAPISSLSLHSDDTSEAGQPIRLLALLSTGNSNEYKVLSVDTKSDSATTEPGNLLSVTNPAGFKFALFQVTTEQEGFDDVNFTFKSSDPVVTPEPASMLLFGFGGAAMALGRLRRSFA